MRPGTLVLLCALCAKGVCGQEAPSSSLPDAPSATADSASNTTTLPPPATPALNEMQTQRVLGGIMPNFRSVSPGVAVAPATPREKMVTATLDNFDYSALIFGGIIAADSFVGKETPEFHQGLKGYSRYYWHTIADQSVENYLVEFIIPSLRHEDSRYYAVGRAGGSALKRLGYSMTRAVVTKSDDGKPMFNDAQIAGSALAVIISNFYYPSAERTVSNGLRSWGQDVGYDAASFVFHEFWPDVTAALMNIHLPHPPSAWNA